MAGVVQLGRPEPDGVLFLAHAGAVEADWLLEVAVAGALVPHEAEAGGLRVCVVGPDVAVEEGALDPHWLPQEDPVLQVVHRPIGAALHCKRKEVGGGCGGAGEGGQGTILLPLSKVINKSEEVRQWFES